MATFALGVYALAGDMRVAAAVAVAIILAMRESLHGWVAKVTWPELRSVLVLLAMTVIALPIMPEIAIVRRRKSREVWLIAIVLAGVSFADRCWVAMHTIRILMWVKPCSYEQGDGDTAGCRQRGASNVMMALQ